MTSAGRCEGTHARVRHRDGLGVWCRSVRFYGSAAGSGRRNVRVWALRHHGRVQLEACVRSGMGQRQPSACVSVVCGAGCAMQEAGQVGCGKARSGSVGRLRRSAPCACCASVLLSRVCNPIAATETRANSWIPPHSMAQGAPCSLRGAGRSQGDGSWMRGRRTRSRRGRRCSASPWGSAVGRGCVLSWGAPERR